MGLGAVDSLNIFESQDGVAFNRPLETSYCSGCVRDPSIAKFGSTWNVVHTCANAVSDTHQFCLTTTTDLQIMTATHLVDTSSFSNTLRDWAPEWVKNPDSTPYLDSGGCPHVTLTLTDGSSSFALYETHPTNCADFTQPWSTPVSLTVTGGGLMLDPFMVCLSPGGGACTGTGDTFYLWYVQLVLSTTQFVQYASSSTLTGTYTQISPGGNWAGWGTPNQEGPMLIKLADRWRIYFDLVPSTPGDISDGQINYSDSFDNWATWTAPHPIQSSIYGKYLQAKHGTVITLP